MGNSKSQISSYPDGTLEVNLANFKLQRVVGKGSYGKVRSPPGQFGRLAGALTICGLGPRC